MTTLTESKTTYRNQLRCRVCKEWKHRQQFVPKQSKHIAYDSRCHACRNKTPIDTYTLESRLAKGLITQEKYDAIKRKNAETLRLTRTANMYSGKRREAATSWETPLRSASYAYRYLRMFNYPDEECRAWGNQVRELIADTKEYIKERREKEKLPTDRLVFWFDVIEGMPKKLKEMIEQYPQGADKCPIQVM